MVCIRVIIAMIVFIKKHRINILIVFIFLILPFIFFRDSFKLDHILLGAGVGDPSGYYIPLHQLTTDLIKNFEFPFWNRYNFSGFPLLANPQASLFYPITTILSLLFSTITAYNLSILISYSLAGVFMYLFLNEYKLSKIASFTGGLIFMFSGTMISHRSSANIIYTIIWTPLILYLLEKYRKSKRLELILITSIIYSFTFFSGQPQLFVYSSIIIIVFIVYYTFIYKGGKNYYFLLSGLIFIIGFLIILVQFIPTYELQQNTDRNNISYEYFIWFSYNPKLLPALIFPYIFGNYWYPLQDVPRYFGLENYMEMTIYFGISTIPLFILGFFRKNWHKYLWIFVLIFSFLLALGKYTPLYEIMYHIPFFNKSRCPARNWFEFGLAFSILSGFGFNNLIKLGKDKIKKIIISSIILLSSIFIIFLIFSWLLRTNLKYSLIDFLGIPYNTESFLYHSIKLTNYSIFIPLIIIICSISILVLFLFKKNKFIYISLILLIFFDLFLMNFFYETNSDIDYINNKIEDSTGLEFLSQENELFRICPVATGVSGIILSDKYNIYKKLDTVTGNDILMQNDYEFITKLNTCWQNTITPTWLEIIKNNNILSMLNTKYIIVPTISIQTSDDIDLFMGNINKYFREDAEPVLNKNLHSEAELANSNLSNDGNKIIFNKSQQTLKLFKVPINIKNNKGYLISFEIKSSNKLDNVIHFDFFGEGYDNPKQEFHLTPDNIDKEYIKINRFINSEKLPSDTDIYFRIFGTFTGEVMVKNLEIYEVKRYRNYEVVYTGNDAFILENKNFLPRFYFPNEVKSISNLQEARNIIWDDDKFDPKKTALVENIDFTQKNFNTKEININIIKYNNNEIILETNSSNNSFLVFSDYYYPGWRASIDNIETKIYKTNGILKGIYLPKGKHTIIFNYTPSYFWVCAIISLSTFIFVIIGAAVLSFRRKRLEKS